MKSQAKLLVFFILIFAKVPAQNLIVNGSFETQTNCCCYADFAQPWELASWSPAKLFDSVSAFNPYCGIPVNLDSALGYQIPRTGHAYSGVNAFWSNTPSYREYLGYPLSSGLEPGKTYCLKFYVNLINRGRYGIDGMGAYFSATSIYCPTQNCVLNYLPQVSNPSGNIILDTLGWTEISGCFIANGDEHYMTIGNFKSDSLTLRDTNRYIPTANYSTFYYIDDVSLYEDTTFGLSEDKIENNFVIVPNPSVDLVTITSYKIIKEINLFDVSGNLILKEVAGKTIDVSGVTKGLYILRCKFGEGDFGYEKVVVQHE